MRPSFWTSAEQFTQRLVDHPAHTAVGGQIGAGALTRTQDTHPMHIGARGLRICSACGQTDESGTGESGTRERGDATGT